MDLWRHSFLGEIPLRSLSLLLVFFYSLTAFAGGLDSELHGYLRAGTGTNGKGGKRECFYNNGAPANEFRLGNECAIYGESAFLVHLLKGDKQEPWFNTQVRLAYFPPGNSSFEDSDSDNREINVVEAFVEAGNIDGSPLTFWAGKRFYRDVDLHMYDWYYYGQMNGNGGGVGNIPLGSGTFAAAYLIETGSTTTNIGTNALQVLDLRWANVKLGEKDALNFWGAIGFAPGGKVSTTGKEYVARSGWLAATRWRHDLADGFNDFAVLYGTRVMEGLSIYGNPALEKSVSGPPDAFRVRLVEHLTTRISSRWEMHFGSGLEYSNPRTSATDSRSLWWSVGARPIYYFTDHWQLAFEGGHSQIKVHSEKSSSGADLGPRTLTRLTIAPQLSLGRSIWARPVVRAYFSHSFWNAANSPYIALNAPSFSGATSGQAVGVQTEVWF